VSGATTAVAISVWGDRRRVWVVHVVELVSGVDEVLDVKNQCRVIQYPFRVEFKPCTRERKTSTAYINWETSHYTFLYKYQSSITHVSVDEPGFQVDVYGHVVQGMVQQYGGCSKTVAVARCKRADVPADECVVDSQEVEVRELLVPVC
jgi:hypothetical protein